MKALLFALLVTTSTLTFAQVEQQAEQEKLELSAKAHIVIELPRTEIASSYGAQDSTPLQIAEAKGPATVQIKASLETFLGDMPVVDATQSFALNKEQAAQVGLAPGLVSYKLVKKDGKNYLELSALGGFLGTELEIKFDKGNVKKAEKGKVFKAHLTDKAQDEFNKFISETADLALAMGQGQSLVQLGQQFGIDLNAYIPAEGQGADLTLGEFEALKIDQVNQDESIIITDKSLEVPATKIEAKGKIRATISQQ